MIYLNINQISTELKTLKMIRLFKEKPIAQAFSIVRENVSKRVNELSDNEIMNSKVDFLADHISNSLNIKPIEIDFESRTAKVDMVKIPWNQFPPNFDVTRGESYSCAKVSYTFPIIKGDEQLLSVSPKGYYFNKDINAKIYNNNLIIEYQTLYGNIKLSEEIKDEVKQFIGETVELIKATIPTIENEVIEFNKTLNPIAIDLIQDKKDLIQASLDQNDDLNDF